MLAYFDRWEIEPDRAILEGPAGRVDITSPLPGVIRLCLATPGLAAKKLTWALEQPPVVRPLRVVEIPSGLAVEVDEARCEIALDPFGWTFTAPAAGGGDRPRSADIRTVACWIGEERRRAEEPHLRPLFETGDEGAPALTSVLDGRVLGHGVTLTLDAPPGRHYYGLGERAGWLDRRGRRYTNWASDISPILASADALYQAIPFLLHLEDGRASGLLVDESWRSVFDLGATDPARAEIRVDGPSLDVYLIAGPAPTAVLERYTALTGRTPLPPLWALGYHQSRWSYRSADEVRALVHRFRAQEIPLDVVHLDIDYMDGYRVFTWDPARFPDPAGLARDLRQAGVRLVLIGEPSLKPGAGYPAYEEAAARGLLVRDESGAVFEAEVWTKPAVFVDFLKPEARTWWGAQFRPLLDAGVSGIWDDMNEPSVRGTPGRTLPVDARHSLGAGGGERTHLEVHNVYGLHHARATWEGLAALRPEERPFVISRSGYAGIQRYAAVWTGDNSSWWEHLEASVPMLLNLGLSGVPFIGADVGGFHGNAEGELLIRWTQLGAFYPLMRNHSIRTSHRQEPWAFGEETARAVRDAIALRYALLPHLYTLMEEAATCGLPPMRPLWFHYPDDPETYQLADEFLWGSDLLVAPAVRPGATHRAVYFPEGRWAEWWTGAIHPGPGWAVVETPLARIPIFLRAGAAVPVTRPMAHTPPRAVWEDLEWRVFPAGTSGPGGRLFEDDGQTPLDRTRAYRISRLALTTDGSRVRLALTAAGALAAARRSLRIRCYGLGEGARLVAPAGGQIERDETGTAVITLTEAADPLEVLLER